MGLYHARAIAIKEYFDIINSMIEIKGNEVYRGGVKIGWISGEYVYDASGKKLGYFSSNAVYDDNGQIMARISGEYVFSGSRQMDIEQLLKDVAGAGISDAGKVAVATFLGE